eukprot:g2668.t1
MAAAPCKKTGKDEVVVSKKVQKKQPKTRTGAKLSDCKKLFALSGYALTMVDGEGRLEIAWVYNEED